MKLEIVVCDVDREVGLPTRRYTVACGDGRTVTADLCEEHAAPFEALLEKPGPEQADGPGSRRAPAKKAGADPMKPVARTSGEAAPVKSAARRRGRLRVTTLEEIEARKRS
jgi:hypothetical protein